MADNLFMQITTHTEGRMTTVIDRMLEIAEHTPDTGEGSRGHLRHDAAWEIADDYRKAMAGDERIRELYQLDENGQRLTLARIAEMCERDAANAVDRWTAEDGRS